MKRIFAAMMLLVVWTGCSTGPETSYRERPFTSLSREQLDICEAVFRYQIQRYEASGLKEPGEAYFLEVCGNNPSTAFLARFSDLSSPVKNGSEFVKGKGLKFMVHRIRMTSLGSAKVDGGSFKSELGAGGNAYSVRKKDGKWVCERHRFQWVS